MIASFSSELTLLRRSSLLQQTVALSQQLTLDEASRLRLSQNLQLLQELDKTVEEVIQDHLGQLFATQAALNLLLMLLEELGNITLPSRGVVALLTPCHDDLDHACRGIAALF
ncbi:hypothetical protein HNQ50_000344 [Silvimonas terrae]|uniref:Uncharacterized protein n=1 Tax=Silvimonas terrae TaxID=300266 RepID=A0A840RAL1_9NEIS|nr:DUF1484 family protein [Silvimonas terrae]MBB5189634.1 hypothetical protein [Silvimonas terrae]